MKFTATYVRVFYNRAREDKKRVWSVDFGPASVEIIATKVWLRGLTQCGTEFDPSQEVGGIRAWMEIRIPVQIDAVRDELIISPAAAV